MEITYINSDNIKIFLTKDDLSENGLTAGTIDYSSTHSRYFIWQLLDKAYLDTGFDPCDDKISVRVFPSKDGSCELFISKFNGGKSKKYEEEQDCKVCVCRDFDSLYSLCRRMKSSGFQGKSSLYCDDKNNFIMTASYKKRLPSYIARKKEEKKPDFSFIPEYCSLFESGELVNAYLSEHCRLLCENNAIEKILI